MHIWKTSFFYIASFRHKVIQSALQGHRNRGEWEQLQHFLHFSRLLSIFGVHLQNLKLTPQQHPLKMSGYDMFTIFTWKSDVATHANPVDSRNTIKGRLQPSKKYIEC